MPCGHCYSEEWWRHKLSTTIDQAGPRGGWRARKARCCAPLPCGGVCGAPLMQTRALRVTRCNPPHAPELPAAGAPARALAGHAVHGYWGSRVEQAVRLLLRLRAGEAKAADAKAVVYTRLEPTVRPLHALTLALTPTPTLTPNPNPNPHSNPNPNPNQVRLLHAACMMNGVRCAVPSGAAAQHALAAFKADPELQVLTPITLQTLTLTLSPTQTLTLTRCGRTGSPPSPFRP